VAEPKAGEAPLLLAEMEDEYSMDVESEMASMRARQQQHALQ